MPTQFLYFDVGNVLLSFSHERMCQQMADVAGVSQQAMWDLLFQNNESASLQCRYESGELNTDQFFECMCGVMGVRPHRRRLEEAVCNIFAEIEPMNALVQSLAATGHRLGLLSNTNPLQWDYFTDGRFPVLASPGGQSSGQASAFSLAVLSYEAGAMKPARRIYEIAVERAGVPAADVFFTDDREDNVAGALAAGLDAVQFTGIEKLTDDLRARGISVR
jgi:glucose-1-phosphatase